ncbi:hypothetical protein [Niabella sp.]|uniref:FEKKY domain-containing protein n=1 Tax=Niabella sp. TaxID=1962976 RepID=UPI0026198CED|nr:hypothetical protein [Niabella sp.]
MKRAIFPITALLMWIIIICSYYAFDYPQSFDIVQLVKQVEWYPLLPLYLALLLFAFILAVIISRKYPLVKTFLKTASILQCIAASFFIILGLTHLYNTSQQYKAVIRETEKRAENNIKRDSVTFTSFGLPVPDSNYQKRNSIQAKYGIYTTFDCVLDPISQKAAEYYEQLTADYLNKRNGRGWEKRMQAELEACQCP